MSLIFFKNNKPDTRMIENDQAIIRLGLERAHAQSELDRIRSEDAEIGSRKATLLRDIDIAEKRLQDIRSEISEAVQKGISETNEVSRSQQKEGELAVKNSKKIKSLEEYLVSLKNDIGIGEITLLSVKNRIAEERGTLDKTKADTATARSENNELEIENVLLKAKNRELADSVAANEEKLTYISSKEQFLNRKEEDLKKYEERVKKQRMESGNNIEMKFI